MAGPRDIAISIKTAFQEAGVTAAKAALKDLGASATADLNRVADASKKVTAAHDAHTQSVWKLDTATKAHAGSLGVWGTALKDVGEHSRTVAIGLEQVGLHAGAGASRLLGLADVFERFGKGNVTPQMIGAGLAIAGIAVAAELAKKGIETVIDVFKDAVTEAGRTQAAMVELRLATENHGESWTAASKEIREWVDTASAASGFTRGELIGGLRQLANAGKVAGDGITYQRVAMELSRATGMDLLSAQNMLVGASEGYYRELVRMGILRAKDIKDGLTQEQMLQHVYAATKTASDAYATTLPGAIARAQSAWANFMDALGTPFLNVLADITNGVANFVNSLTGDFEQMSGKAKGPLRDLSNQFKGSWDGITGIVRFAFDFIVGDVKAGWDLIVGTAKVAGDFLRGDIGKMWEDIGAMFDAAFSDLLGAFGTFGENMAIASRWIGDRIKDGLSAGIHAALDAASGNFIKASIDLGQPAVNAAPPKLVAYKPDALQSVLNRFKRGKRKPSAALPKLKNNRRILDEKGSGKQDLAALFSPIDAMIALAKHAAEVALNALEETQVKLAVLRDKRDPKATLTYGNVLEEQRLERQEVERTLALRKAIANERDVELRAAQMEHALMGRISGTAQEQSKAHAEIAKRMNEHITAASKLNGEFIKMGGTLAKLGREIRDALDPLKKQQLELDAVRRTGVHDQAVSSLQRSAEQSRQAFIKANTTDPTTALQTTEQDVEQARFAQKIAHLNLKLAEADQAAAKLKAALEDPVTAAHTLAAAWHAHQAAAQADEIAMGNLKQAHLRYEKALDDTSFTLSRFAKGLIDKLGIGGLTAYRNVDEAGHLKGGLKFGFDPTSFLLQAAEQTKAFADVQKVATEIMRVFAQVIDALRPVIDLVLKAVGAVANIFISLYNVVARILRVFGLHIALLDKINTDFGALDQVTAPLISIIHELPTMNELASGNIGVLSPTAHTYSNLAQVQQPTIDAIKSPDLGGGLLGGILEVVAGIGALKVLLKALGLSNTLFGSGGGGGILGFLKGLFGGGGGGSADGANIDTSTLDALGFSTAGRSAGGSGGGLLSSIKSALNIGTVKGLATAAAEGFVGSLIGKAEGGGSHTTNAAVGAMLAGAQLGIMFGPVGAIVGTLLGGAIGGLFGHADNKQNMPDKYLPGYQDFLASFNSGPGGQGDQLEKLVAGTDPSKLTGQALADYNRLKADEAGTGQLGIKNEKDDIFTLFAGTKERVEDFIDLTKRAFGELGSAATDALGGAMQTLAQQAQSITRGVDALGNQLAGVGGGGAAALSSAVAAAASSGNGGSSDVNLGPLHFHGDINTPVDLEEMYQRFGAIADRALRTRPFLLGG